MFKDYLKKNSLVTGRGSTAIYLAFKNEKLENIDVLVPGNICYAAIYPIVYSNNNPVFCDVDIETGNLTLNIIKENITGNTKAILIPHMYGNTVNELDKIKIECNRRNIVLIEDCASSFGATNINYGQVGKIGDYVIHSFGYSKIIDLGNGGLLTSDKNLDIAKSCLDNLPLFNDEIIDEENNISKLYRKVRNKQESYLKIRRIDFKKALFYRLNESILEKISDKIIFDTISMHINNYHFYDGLINNNYKRYEYNDGSIPWRFSLLVDEDKKHCLINRLLERKLPVSDWYPNVTEFFLDKKKNLKNVDIMEASIINFPLDIECSLIKEICYTINSIE